VKCRVGTKFSKTYNKTKNYSAITKVMNTKTSLIMLMFSYLPNEYGFELEISYLNRTTRPTILHFKRKIVNFYTFSTVLTVTWFPPDIFSKIIITGNTVYPFYNCINSKINCRFD
jgi:hypothetical protein